MSKESLMMNDELKSLLFILHFFISPENQGI